MAKKLKRTIELTEDEAAFIDRKVATGEFGSPSAVVSSSLHETMVHDAAMETWLRNDVVPTIREHEADPNRARPADEVFDRLERKLLRKMKAAE